MSIAGVGRPTIISSRGRVKRTLPANVWEASIARITQAYQQFDTVVVGFSGGKDSSVMFHLCRKVATELDRLPVHVMMFDDELIDDDTVAWCEDIRTWPDVDFRWYTIPIRHSVASLSRPFWWTWDPDLTQDDWARIKPTWGEELDGWQKFTDARAERGALAHAGEHVMTHAYEGARKILFTGIRTEESFNRHRALLNGTWQSDRGTHVYAKPIYDWKWTDVWKALHENQWGYSRFYDKIAALGVAPAHQRVAPWGNAAQVREVGYWPELYPDLWDRAIRRLPELRAMARYGATGLYRGKLNKPVGWTWQQYTRFLLSRMDDESRAFWATQIKNELIDWKRTQTIPYPEEDFMQDGIREGLHSWKRFAGVIVKNDRTGRDRS